MTASDMRLFIRGRWHWSPADWLTWALSIPLDILIEAIQAVGNLYDETLDDDAESHFVEICVAFHFALTGRVAPSVDAPTLEELAARKTSAANCWRAA